MPDSTTYHRSSVSESTVTQLLSTYYVWSRKSMKIKQFSPFPTATIASTIVELIAPGNERAILLRGERAGETFTDGGPSACLANTSPSQDRRSPQRERNPQIFLSYYIWVSSNTYWKQSHLRLAEILRWTIELWFEIRRREYTMYTLTIKFIIHSY